MILNQGDDLQAFIEEKMEGMKYLLIPIDPSQVYVVGKVKMIDAASHQARYLTRKLLDEIEAKETKNETE